MSFLHLFIFQCWGIEGGALFLNEIGSNIAPVKGASTPIVGVYYLVEISEKWLIRESLDYWEKGYNKVEGTNSKECIFSSLSFKETALLRFRKSKTEFGLGPGIGIHLLKNRVKEKNEYGSWIITEYYCLTSNSVGFHIEAEAGIKFSKIILSGGIRIGVVLLSPVEENLFYTRGNLRGMIYSVKVSF